MRMTRALLLSLLLAALAACATPYPPAGPSAGAQPTRPAASPQTAPEPAASPPGAPGIPVLSEAPPGTGSAAAVPSAPEKPAVPADPAAEGYALMKRVHEALSRPGEAFTTLSLARDLAGRLPEHPDAWLLLGWAARRAQSPVVANAAFRRAFELDGSRVEALFALGEVAAEAGSPAAVREHLVHAWKDSPGPESARRLAAADIAARRLDEARSLLSAARDALPGEEAIAGDLSAALDMAGNPAQALSVLPYREGMPTRLILSRVSLMLRQGQLEGAAIEIEKALSREDAGPGAILLLGILKMQRGDLPGAEEQFRALTAGYPGLPEGFLDLGLALRRQGKFADARAAYEAGLLARETPELHLNLGVLDELYLGDKAGARAHYRRYVELSGAGADRVRGWIEFLAPATGSAPGAGGKP
jgi:Tfp pilus assembly protein PilF